LGESGSRFALYREVGGFESGLDAKRAARGHLVCDFNGAGQCSLRRVDDVLDRAHPISVLHGPVVACQHVAHGVAPASLVYKAHGRTAARKAAVRILILAKVRIGGRDPDIGG
jgi:hypothetical protein